MKNLVLFMFILLNCNLCLAQSAFYPAFPQDKINREMKINSVIPSSIAERTPVAFHPTFSNPLSAIKAFDTFRKSQSDVTSSFSGKQAIDTILVGDVPNDTLVITGTWNHNGPIWVFNDGVLIIYKANVTNQGGDLIVFGNGIVLADSSTFNFPQQYFYERGIIAVHHAYVHLQNSSFNYSGLSHNLVIGDSATVELVNIHQSDWTTCGLFGSGSLYMNGCNIGGEYILSEASTSAFIHVDTLILWHQFPSTAVINYSFPAGDSVYNYLFNSSMPGINGISYSTFADSCHNVMWALMPVNGSDVTVSNSVIRAIGAWFTQGDSVTVNGVFNNSTYTNYVMPVTDRNLQLINSFVQTWSFYAFDSSHVNIDSCQLGEVGCQQRASVNSENFLLDGSGGYFWATDTGFIIANNVTIYTTARSEKNGIFALVNSWLPFSSPSAIGNSLMVCVQDSLAADPIPFDGAIVWLQKIEGPDTALTNSTVQITGSAWIDQGPLGSWMDFGNYSLFYQQAGSGIWIPVVSDSISEIHHGILGNWNTNGLPAGVYFLRLLVKNDLNDSIEAIRPVILKSTSVSVGEMQDNSLTVTLNPNPASTVLELFVLDSDHIELNLYDIKGGHVLQEKAAGSKTIYNISHISPGVYYYCITNSNRIMKYGKIVIE